jgi:GTP-binding protein
MAKLATPKLTRVLIDAVARQSPPRSGMFRPKMRYAHQGGSNPPIIVVHGNALDEIPDSYRRYLEHTFREAFRLTGTPLRVQFKSSVNPFADREPAVKAMPRDKMRAKGKDLRQEKTNPGRERAKAPVRGPGKTTRGR